VKRPVCATVAVLAMLAAGCGSKSESEKVKSTVQSYVDGLASRDGKKVCDQLASAVQVQVQQRYSVPDCPAGIAKVESSAGRAIAPAFKTAEIKEVNVKGNVASAGITVKVNGKDNPATIPLEKVGGSWKITAAAEG
jgi:uncharacterized lipoprotein